MLRGRALEIVDDHGRVLRNYQGIPERSHGQDARWHDGIPRDSAVAADRFQGPPNVKISATEDGSAVSLGGESNPTHVQILARGTSTSLKLVNKDGREQLIKPQ